MPKVNRPEPPTDDDRREALAVSLFDLGRCPPDLRAYVVPRLRLERGSEVRPDINRTDEAAAPFACPLLTAAVALDLLRAGAKRIGLPPPRVYVRRARAWSRLPGDAILTVPENGRPALSPDVFPRAVESVPYQPPPRGRVF